MAEQSHVCGGSTRTRKTILGPLYRLMGIHPRRFRLSSLHRREVPRCVPIQAVGVASSLSLRSSDAEDCSTDRRTSKREQDWDPWLVARTRRRRTARSLGVAAVQSREEEVRVAMGLREEGQAIAENLHVRSVSSRDWATAVSTN